MHGVVTLLPTPYYEKVESLWAKLELQFGVSGIYVTPYPHFSWQIGRHYPSDVLQKSIQEISHQVKSLTFRTSGIGIFSGSNPVVYIQVIKDKHMLNLHQVLWKRLEDIGEGMSPYYQPNRWMPHISLGYGDITEGNSGEILKWLAFQDFNWEMNADNLSFIYEPDGKIGKLIFSEVFQG